MKSLVPTLVTVVGRLTKNHQPPPPHDCCDVTSYSASSRHSLCMPFTGSSPIVRLLLSSLSCPRVAWLIVVIASPSSLPISASPCLVSLFSPPFYKVQSIRMALSNTLSETPSSQEQE
ncbi:uncharacterized protein DS421_17g583230 [Arachis hypogaea]|nr:uncharacterized protein DS421_17g583230 [Arachis hypogaea]